MAGDAAAAPIGRPMKYPYTYTAKLVQFPLKFHIQNNWVCKYYMFGLILTLPVIIKLHKMANSPGNVQKWAEKKKKEMEAHH